MLILFGTLSAIIVGAGSFMYVVIMGPSRYHRNGIVGSIYRWLRRLPVALIGACCSIGMRCNQRAGRAKSEVCLSHVLHERHWYMVVFYAVLVLPVEYLYLIHALPELEASLLSKATSWALVLVSEALFVAAVVSDPGTVTTTPTSSTSSDAASSPSRKVGDRKGGRRAAKTSSSAARPGSRFTEEEEYVLNRRYAVDGMLYALANPKERDGVVQEQDELTCSWRRSREAGVGVACYTCHQRKPSRSKHCQLCGRCVRRFDHHCPWINNDVAEGNYRYFLGFLFTHAISCTWAMWDLFAGIRQFFVAKNAWHWRILLSNGSTYPLGISEYLMLFLNFQMRNSLLFIFAFFIGLVLYGFWTYSMTFAVANLTVNDMIKIDEISEFIDGLATPEVVFREATKIRTRLEQVAERPPVALLKLVPPPVVEAGDATAELQVAKYRKSVRKMVVADLKHLFDRGTWNNLMEILFPYAIITRTNLAEVRRVKSKG